MTWRSWLMALFPPGLVAGALALLLAPSALLGAPLWQTALLGLGSALAALYLVPPLVYRLHDRLAPLETGGSYLAGASYSPWWGGHQIQLIYLAFPGLESGLRLVPGLYSAWLRLWGAQIGRGVYWTPQVEIADRGLVEIGDGVVIGHRVTIAAHVIKPTKDNLLLLVRKVRIGDGAFIGAGAVLGPGVKVEPKAFVRAGAHLYPGGAIKLAEDGAAPGADAAAARAKS